MKQSENLLGNNPEIHKDWQEIKRTNTRSKPEEIDIPEEIIGIPDSKETLLDALLPDWAKGSPEAEAIWQDFVSEFLQADIDADEENATITAEYFNHYYRIILGELAECFLPQEIKNDHHGFGRGFWGAEYYAGGDPQNFSAAQYLSPRNILESETDSTTRQLGYTHAIRSTHFNLCGQLAVIEALGINLTQGLRTFYEEVDHPNQSGRTILGNPNRGTYASELIQFILAVADQRNEKWEVTHHYLPWAAGRLDAIIEMIESADLVIALVNIDPSQTGKGRVGMGGSTAHWVTLQEVVEMAGEIFLRLYNPFMNREELYLWEVFDRSWEFAEINSAPRFIRGKRIA